MGQRIEALRAGAGHAQYLLVMIPITIQEGNSVVWMIFGPTFLSLEKY